MQIPFNMKNETIYLTADDNNYCLAKLTDRTRDGVSTQELSPFKWFATIGQALNRIVDMKIKSSDAKSLKELKQVVEQAKSEVNSIWDTSAKAR